MPTQAPKAPNADSLAESPVEPIRILMPSPIGSLGVELEGTAISRLIIVPKGKERRGFQPFTEVDRSDAVDDIIGSLSEYLAGARRSLRLEHSLTHAEPDNFTRRVLKETAKIPFGKTRTYQEIAKSAGRPNAYRQVLSILLVNPVPLVVPCHRVIPSKSGVGSYIAGTKKKQRLLKLEQEALRRNS